MWSSLVKVLDVLRSINGATTWAHVSGHGSSDTALLAQHWGLETMVATEIEKAVDAARLLPSLPSDFASPVPPCEVRARLSRAHA